MDPTVVKTIAELGVPTAVLVAVLWFWYKQQQTTTKSAQEIQEKIVSVVENNTTALTRLCDSTAATSTSLAAHDERAERIEANVGQLVRVADRTEKQVNEIHAATVVKGKGQ